MFMHNAGIRGAAAGVLLTLAITGFIQDSFGLHGWITFLSTYWQELNPWAWTPFAAFGAWLLVSATELGG